MPKYITLTLEQWQTLVPMIDRGIEDALYYADDYADRDDPTGEYSASLRASAAAAQQVIEEVSA